MTKETKIGLLVGLAFIIIVGILLGDSVRHATDVQPASLPQVADNVRNAVTTPGTPVAPPISLAGTNGGLRNATPLQPVPTHEEISQPAGGGIVLVGPGNSQPANITSGSHNNNEIVVDAAARTNVPTATGNRPITFNPNDARGNSPLHELARQNGEEIVPAGPTRPETVLASAKGNKTYQAAPGDSLGKIASRFYGSSAKPLQDAIINANPSMKGNPDRILVGQTYTIPAANTASVSPAPAAPIPASRGGSGIAPSPEYYYTVKENDNLWRIARDQVGDPSAVPALKELNKDILKGGETVRVNMKLRLPGKPVASTN